MKITIDTREVAEEMIERYSFDNSPEGMKRLNNGFMDTLIEALTDIYSLEDEVISDLQDLYEEKVNR